MKARDTSYLIGFFDHVANLYDVHICDNFDDHGTREYFDFSFTEPRSKFMLFWRRDRRNFTSSEAKYILKSLRDDLDDFIHESRRAKPFYKIVMKMIGKDCLMISWTPIIKITSVKDALGGFSNWSEFTEQAQTEVENEAKIIARTHNSLHDRKINLYDSRYSEL